MQAADDVSNVPAIKGNLSNICLNGWLLRSFEDSLCVCVCFF